jgi:protoheme IX farnesyltransferase
MIARFLKHVSTLCRLPVALMTGLSAMTGCLLTSSRSPLFSLGVAASVFVLAAGASALNQVQERDIDRLMARTRSRPLPSGALSPGQGLVAALFLIVFGLAMLATSGMTPLILGIGAIIWYNGVYTPLKRTTAFAAVPGALVGMIPPAIGWSAAGGALADPRLLAVCFFFFLWQVPHFWLQILHHGEEYDQAGLPSLTRQLGRPVVSRLTYAWTFAAAVSVFLLPLYGVLTSPRVYAPLVPAAIVVIAAGFRLLVSRSNSRERSAFLLINGYLLLVMTLLSIDGLLHMP